MRSIFLEFRRCKLPDISIKTPIRYIGWAIPTNIFIISFSIIEKIRDYYIVIIL